MSFLIAKALIGYAEVRPTWSVECRCAERHLCSSWVANGSSHLSCRTSYHGACCLLFRAANLLTGVTRQFLADTSCSRVCGVVDWVLQSSAKERVCHKPASVQRITIERCADYLVKFPRFLALPSALDCAVTLLAGHDNALHCRRSRQPLGTTLASTGAHLSAGQDVDSVSQALRQWILACAALALQSLHRVCLPFADWLCSHSAVHRRRRQHGFLRHRLAALVQGARLRKPSFDVADSAAP